MVFLTTANAVGRYVFNAPILGANEMLSMMMAALVFLSLAIVEREDRHLKVTIIIHRLPATAQSLIKCAGYVLAISIMTVITWRIAVLSSLQMVTGQGTLVLHAPLFIITVLMVIGAIPAVLSFLSSLCDEVRELASRGRTVLLWLIPTCVLPLLVVIAPFVIQVPPFGLERLHLGLIGFAGMLLLIVVLGLHIAIVLLVVGFLGTWYIMGGASGLEGALTSLAVVAFEESTSYGWIVLPLFIYMGNLVSQGGLARDLYSTGHKWVGHMPGGLAMATIGGCAGFAAACGDSLSTAVTMGKVALPEMRRHKYDLKLATGTLAAGGTLGILIPPSLGFIVYGLITDQSIGKLFIAGILPGIMLASLFMALIYLRVQRNPSLCLRASGVSWKERLISLRGSIGILILFVLVIGGIYVGFVTPSEGGGLGALGALLIALIMGRWTRQGFATATRDAVGLNGAVFLIIIGAMVFGYFITISNIPIEISHYLTTSDLGKWGVFGLVLLLYIILGCVMNIMPAMIITLPMIYPTLLALGFDPIWLGVILVITMEMGQVTPPIGINVFGIASVARDIPMGTIFAGILPFLLMMLVAIGILIVFPQIATFLPNIMK